MSLIRWNPSREIDDVFNVFNRSFPSFFGRDPGLEPLATMDWAPPVDISETPEGFQVECELPAMKKEEIKVTVQDGVLTLMGERRREHEEKKGKKLHRVERSYGRFTRTFTMPAAIDEQKVSATFRDGVLHISLPKTEKPQITSREIKIA